MSARHNDVDFLIVTALSEETKSGRCLLENKVSFAHDTLGKISRQGTSASYDIALVEVGEMGTNEAQAVVREALARRNPKRVILTGIAAGFPESGVKLGDVLVPYAIVPYELAKLREKAVGTRKGFWRRLFAPLRPGVGDKRVEYEHRGLATRVSHSLWHAADTLGKDNSSEWWRLITQERPDRMKTNPAVHSKSLTVLGSGEKVVATELADAREWLLKEYPRQAIGLEMESYGVLKACSVTDSPFLVVKASQDPATGQKDIASEKDLWRKYASQSAAAFTVSLIRRFELEYDALILEHMKEVKEVVRVFERDAPIPSFTYKISRAQTYSQLKTGAYEFSSQDPSVLIPNEALPAIVLHGGGGTGKTRIVHSLLAQVVASGDHPVLLDLRKYSVEGEQGKKSQDKDTLIEEIISAASIPRRTPREIERLAKEGHLIIMIDGLNEVTREVRSVLVDYVRTLRKNGTCYLLVTDRFGTGDSLETFHHAVVDRLDPTEVRTLFNGVFGSGAFEHLDTHSQEVFCRPFFLSLALRTRRLFTGPRLWSSIFQEFFFGQLHMSEQELNNLAKATLQSFDKEGTFDLTEFKQNVDPEAYQILAAAEVVGREDTGFEHYLWRDYLVSRHLAHTEGDWKDYVFDVVTTFSYSLESLSLTVEQLRDRESKDTFLKAVFDWNYRAAADCIAEFREDDPGPRQVSSSIRSAILTAVAEKRFDSVERTRRRAEEICREHRYEFARPFIDSHTLKELQKHVAGIQAKEEWFMAWRALFTAPDGSKFTSEQIDLIQSEDSIIGWAAANLARRGILDVNTQKNLRRIYEESASEFRKSVRWRVVSVLGAYPDVQNVVMLLDVLHKDPYHWVQYGAARSLVESAARSDSDLRRQVFSGLAKFVAEYGPAQIWVRRQIFQEIVEVAFIRNPRPGWKDAIMSLLVSIVDKEKDPTYRVLLTNRLKDFEGYNENE